MSYDLGLYYEKESAQVENHQEGSVYLVGGSLDATINITWNYAPYYYKHLDAKQGLRWLYGKTGDETVDQLEQAVTVLGTEQHEDYWKATPGNAGHALSVLLTWARQHPDAVWRGD